MKSDIIRWNEKYSGHNYTKAIQPDLVLMEIRFALGGKGVALDLATGTGNNALYLAYLGYDTFAVDGSINALQFGKRKAIENNLSVNWFVADLDSYALPKEFFDVIVVVKYLNRSLIRGMKDSLKAGGLLLYKTFNTNLLSCNSSFPENYVLKDGELKQWFSDWCCIRTNDDSSNNQTQSFWVGTKNPQTTNPPTIRR